jgi:membrane dipeptidase
MTYGRREFLKLFAAGAAFPGVGYSWGASAPLPGADVDTLFDAAIVIDSLAVGHQWDEVEYRAVKESGYTGIQTTLPSDSLATATRALVEWNQRVRENPNQLLRAVTAADVERAKREGKLGVIFGFQNATMLEGEVKNLDLLYELGTRCIQLTYNSRNLLGDGCTERTNAGLSDMGVAVVERMNELGIIVDLSHCGIATTNDGIEVSRRPPAITHSFCEALYRGHPRAKTDDQIKALANRGGVIGITALGYFVGPEPTTSIEDYLNHVDHAVRTGGIDHVGLATDFQIRGIEPWATKENWYEPRLRGFKPSYRVRWPPWIQELDEPRRFRNVARGLDRRGYSSRDIEKILGVNWLRYFREIFGA